MNPLGINLKGFNQINDFMLGLESYHKTFDSVSFNSKVDSMIFVKNGGVILRGCLMTLNFVMKCNQEVLTMITLCKGTNSMIANCEIKGNLSFPTIGIVINNATCVIKETVVDGFSKGGILMWLEHEDVCKIFASRVKNCKNVGIQIMGHSQSPLIEHCFIEENSGSGIQICTANSCQIKKSKIQNNSDGIECISCDPLIFKNIISKNNQNGIVTRAVEDLICQPKIQLNEISSNRSNGIYCYGFNNMTRIEENTAISFNKLAGIKIDQEATVFIFNNKSFKNIHQGILVCEKASAHIENNQISENIKANLAFGGEGSNNNSVIKNKIFGGRCEGIFVIEGGYSFIYRNTIEENYDGIICCTANPQIVHNTIKKNRRNG